MTVVVGSGVFLGGGWGPTKCYILLRCTSLLRTLFVKTYSIFRRLMVAFVKKGDLSHSLFSGSCYCNLSRGHPNICTSVFFSSSSFFFPPSKTCSFFGSRVGLRFRKYHIRLWTLLLLVCFLSFFLSSENLLLQDYQCVPKTLSGCC